MRKKHLQFPFATLAMLCLLTLTTTLAQADDTSNPQVHSSWGAIKAIYRGNTPIPYTAERVEESTAQVRKPGISPMATYGGDWSNNVLSEAFYTLDLYRTGSSTCAYNGMAMSDWVQRFGYTYPRSDAGALANVSAVIGSANVGVIDGTWNGCPARGGYCKFFVDLVLYRSSYGIGNGYHLILPGGTYYYGGYMTPYDPHQAQPGWVIQRAGSHPHSAIVAANLGWGLDLIDSNYVGGDGNFVIARHAMSWGDLSGFTAYRATYMRQF